MRTESSNAIFGAMSISCATPSLPRPLTEHERTLTRYMIEHGDAPAEEKSILLDQLERASVVGGCPCGCASVDFTLCGLFVFRCAELLSGIEIYSLSGAGSCAALPSPEDLRPFRS